ncbi:hypothetical protein DYB30_010152 [Aphanomyces astaci]|uniref:Uncharacterized protein n=1 Tax=Aphanomyces astaci TaxID=112090 RepID=A0A397ECB3_APHAT|nr:hypothetical protein DYB30_010152 [Aphanomyces astaci]
MRVAFVLYALLGLASCATAQYAHDVVADSTDRHLRYDTDVAVLEPVRDNKAQSYRSSSNGSRREAGPKRAPGHSAKPKKRSNVHKPAQPYRESRTRSIKNGAQQRQGDAMPRQVRQSRGDYMQVGQHNKPAKKQIFKKVKKVAKKGLKVVGKATAVVGKVPGLQFVPGPIGLVAKGAQMINTLQNAKGKGGLFRAGLSLAGQGALGAKAQVVAGKVSKVKAVYNARKNPKALLGASLNLAGSGMLGKRGRNFAGKAQKVIDKVGKVKAVYNARKNPQALANAALGLGASGMLGKKVANVAGKGQRVMHRAEQVQNIYNNRKNPRGAIGGVLDMAQDGAFGKRGVSVAAQGQQVVKRFDQAKAIYDNRRDPRKAIQGTWNLAKDGGLGSKVRSATNNAEIRVKADAKKVANQVQQKVQLHRPAPQPAPRAAPSPAAQPQPFLRGRRG